MLNICCWIRAKLDVWLMQFSDAFDVWGDDDDE